MTELSGLWAMAAHVNGGCGDGTIGIRQILDKGLLERIHGTKFTNCWKILFIAVDCCWC